MRSYTIRPRLSDDAGAILEAAATRTGVSGAALVEYLVRRYGPAVRPPLDPRLLPPAHRGKEGLGRRKKS